MKHIYCAACGTEVFLLRKVINQQIIEVVEPHSCCDPIKLPPLKERELILAPRDRNKADFSTYRMLQELDKLNKPTDTIFDRRPKEAVKDITISSAPQGLLDQLKPSPPKQRPLDVSGGSTEPDLEE